MVSYDFLNSRDTRMRGSWSMLEKSWVSFNYIIAIYVPLPALNPRRMSCICRLALRRVSISTSTNFHRVYNRPMPRVLVVPFVIRTRTVHTSSWGISPMLHMCCTMSTRHSQHSLRGRGLLLLPGLRLPSPLLGVLCAEVGVSACPVWA